MTEKPKDPNPLQYIKGVGPRRAEVLVQEGIITPRDLLFYFPRAYINHDAVASLKSLSVKLRQEMLFTDLTMKSSFSLKGLVTVVARITDMQEHSFGKNKKILTLNLSDGSGTNARIVFWQYHEYYKKTYPVGQLVAVSGKAEIDDWGKISFHHPEIEKFEEEDEIEFKSGGVLPVYRISDKMRNAGLNTRQLRVIIENVIQSELSKVSETLPPELLAKFSLPDIKTAVRNLHFPLKREDTERSLYRMKFEEIFYFELFLGIRQQGVKIKENGIEMNPKSPKARQLYDALPFELTKDQKKVIREITDDMKSGKPMNRLLQGDVGSGKTIVALLSMLVAIDNGCQVAFLAPTEILAEQHLNTFKYFLKDTAINIIQLLGGQKAKLRREILEQISIGFANIIVGTHALFQNTIDYKNLGLIIIDEQHRFGVAQRAELKALATKSFKDKSISPHILVMSATPIPRTLSMTIYGDLDVSLIREMPKNRKPIKTKVVFESELDQTYEFIKNKIRAGNQAFVVYPLVEKSEKLELKAAVEHFEILSSSTFIGFKCGLLHGQMLWYEKEDAMKAFLNKEYDILISTTVIEVGIDIPNATVILIQDSNRFGLSQLHQLRGRVGRGAEQSFCFLATKDNFRFELNKKGVSDDDRKSAVIRLKTMEETTDGFEIAEVDLKLRGPGDVLGTRQSGLPAFKHLDLVNDGEIITIARKTAFAIAEDDPHLRKPENAVFRKEYLKKYYSGRLFIDIA